MMLIIFAGIVGGIGFNPLLFGLGIPLIIVIAIVAKQLFMKKNELIEKDLESKINSLTTDEPLNQSNKQGPGLHPAEDDHNATKSQALQAIDPEHEDDNTSTETLSQSSDDEENLDKPKIKQSLKRGREAMSDQGELPKPKKIKPSTDDDSDEESEGRTDSEGEDESEGEGEGPKPNN